MAKSLRLPRKSSFHYIVESYDEKNEFFSVKYRKKAVKVGGSLFFAFEEKDDSSISGISFKDVRERQRRYHDAYRRRDIMTHSR